MQWIKKYTLILVLLFGFPALIITYQVSCASEPSNTPDQDTQADLITILKSDRQNPDPKRQRNITEAIHTHNQTLFHSNSPSIGPQNSTIPLVVFFDYQCSHCKMMAPILDTLQNDNHTLKIIYKELPILGDHSLYAAKAALAAQKQGQYHSFGAQLMNIEPLSKKNILEIAKKSGLNMSQFQTDLDSDQVNQEILDNFMLAKALTIKGTPTILILSEPQKNQDNLGYQTPKSFFIMGHTDLENLQECINQAQGL